jgi:hypothetical protein
MRFRLVRLRALAVLAVALVPLVALAQQQPQSGDGFMFGAPSGNLTFRAGYGRPSQGSDVFSFAQEHLTLNSGDLAGTAFGADLAYFVKQNIALQFGIGYAGHTAPSVYRNWIDSNDKEIEQSTTFRRVPLSAGVRYYLWPTGRTISDLAWVPSRYAPYLGAGVGLTWYQFRQAGDFVDYKTLDIFPSTLNSEKWTTSVYAAAGVERTLSARFALTGEARYDYAKAPLGSDFTGFDRIDVSGLAVTIGLTVRF